ncbi:hypothetical protein [Actimicrobium antarcticum]|uniref:DUF2863 family protein n=1 Tax=Actimicrobium antarcticum TaxID=1051899 RepID=A0ABP7SW60_9BURK
MPKNKKPAPRKSAESPEQKDDALTRQLCALAAYLAGSPAKNATARENAADFYKIIKKSLHQKKDDILYEALEWTRHDAIKAHLLLKEAIEETAEVVVIQRDGASATEINAFVIPLFLHTTGGLKGAQCFQDQEAYELLTKSLQEAGLESPDATVVLVNHAYQLDEIDGITFSHLHEMVRDAHASMHDMRAATATAIGLSIGEPADEPFAEDDMAVELRFLVGFSMKSVDDTFYQVPADDAAADAYFAARESRFQLWTEQVTPLIKRCFGPADREIEVHFLYQDLFHGGKERGISEYFMLQMMSDLNYGLSEQGLAVTDANAIMGLAEVGDEKVLRVNLYAKSDAALLASSEKPLIMTADLASEMDDVRDALGMIGIASISVAASFDDEGVPVGVVA